MEDFDSTNYDDFLLSNFRNVSNKPINDEVEVEITPNDEKHINYESKTYDVACEEIKHIPIVKAECLQIEKNEDERREPQTLSVVFDAIEKNKHLNSDKSNNIKNKNSKIKKRFVLVVLVLVIGFISCLLISDAISGGYIIDSAVKKIFNEQIAKSYYAVEIASFNDIDSARITSEEIRASGGSGYVIHDNELYRVIAEIYAEEKQAASVSAKLNLAGYVTSVYKIEFKEINYSLFPISVRNITRNVMKYQEIMYQTLYEVSQKLENAEIDFGTAKVEIKALKSQISNMLVEYESNVDNEIDNKYVLKVRMQLNAMAGALDNLCGDSVNNDRLLSDIRYINSTIINTHKALVNSLQ